MKRLAALLTVLLLLPGSPWAAGPGAGKKKGKRRQPAAPAAEPAAAAGDSADPAAAEAPPEGEDPEAPAPKKAKRKPAAPAGLVYGKDMNGKKVVLRPGQVFVVQLAGEPAGGGSWVLSRLDGIALDPVGEVEFHPDKAKPGAPKTGGTYSAGFRAVKAGPALIEMEYRRYGQRVEAEQLFNLKVDVQKPARAKDKDKGKSKLRPIPGEDGESAGSGDGETPPEEKPAEGEGDSSSEAPPGD